MMFYTSSPGAPPTLAVGTNRGTVFLVKPDLTVISLNQRYMPHCHHHEMINRPIYILCCRVSKQQEVYPSLFESSGYNCRKIVTFASCPSLSSVVGHSLRQPSTLLSPNLFSQKVVSVHADGSVILWSITHLEPLCTVALPSSPPALPIISALTIKCIFLAGMIECSSNIT